MAKQSQAGGENPAAYLIIVSADSRLPMKPP